MSGFLHRLPETSLTAFGQTTSRRITIARRTGRSALRPMQSFMRGRAALETGRMFRRYSGRDAPIAPSGTRCSGEQSVAINRDPARNS
jgi:hypothetical protein